MLELANHDATFAVIEELKTEGIIELDESQAMWRFERRMEQNGGYRRNDETFYPSAESVTTDPISMAWYYVDFQSWRKDVALTLRYTESGLMIDKVSKGNVDQPLGGSLQFEVYDHNGELLQLAPKRMVGPSLVVAAYVDERPFSPLLPAHAFPVVSVEELKW